MNRDFNHIDFPVPNSIPLAIAFMRLEGVVGIFTHLKTSDELKIKIKGQASGEIDWQIKTVIPTNHGPERDAAIIKVATTAWQFYKSLN